MLFDIKKKEKKIFGTELSDSTREILTAFAIKYSEIGEEHFEVLSVLPDFAEVPDNILREQYYKYAKVVYRRYILKSIAGIAVETAALIVTVKNIADIAYDVGVKDGAKDALNTPAVKELEKQTKYRVFDDIYHEAQKEGQAVITCDFDDGSHKEYIVATIQDEIPEVKKEA